MSAYYPRKLWYLYRIYAQDNTTSGTKVRAVCIQDQGSSEPDENGGSGNNLDELFPIDRRIARCLRPPRRRRRRGNLFENSSEGVCYVITRVIHGSVSSHHTGYTVVCYLFASAIRVSKRSCRPRSKAGGTSHSSGRLL